MQVPTGDLGDRRAAQFLLAEADDTLRRVHFAVDACVGKAGARLAFRVDAPAPRVALLVDGERVVVARADDSRFAGARAQYDLLGGRTCDLAALDDTPAELAFFASAEGVDVALGGEEDEVVVAGCGRDPLFILEVEDRDGLVLLFGVAREADEALVALQNVGMLDYEQQVMRKA